jgi:hypothetical protein
MAPVMRKYLLEAEDQDKKKVKEALSKIKDIVEKIISAIKDGYMATAAKAVAKYTDIYGAPFTEELQTKMLPFKDNKQFVDSWRDELSKQTVIYKELHPTNRTPEPPKKDEKPPSERA